jgi:NAD-dependent SIR2 family protein deacetylase
MSPARFVCPHCHAPVDPALMERADSALGELRVCPQCDAPVLFRPAATAAPKLQSVEPARVVAA